jgi:hypothetical protein
VASSATGRSTCGSGGGYDGPVEVEPFNDELWARDGVELLMEVAERYTRHAL